MNCDKVRAEDIVERYMLGQLDDAERDDFEAHYFSCSSCHEEVQIRQDLQSKFRDTDGVIVAKGSFESRRNWAIPATLAASIAAFGFIIWAAFIRPSVEPNALIALSSFNPPQYAQSTLRGYFDDAQELYLEAMSAYGAGNWPVALSGLEAAAELDPTAANISFFLGVCQLLTDETAHAITTLNQTIQLGESPYLQEAYFYLAKAHLRSADRSAALQALQNVVELHGDLESEARTLIQHLNSLNPQ